MIPIRRSSDTSENEALRELKPTLRESNSQWLNRQWLDPAQIRAGLLLLGGSSVADFRIRVAQSHLRQDLSPSFWSHAGILVPNQSRFESVPLDLRQRASDVASRNAVQVCELKDYDDPWRYPNIAVLHFVENPEAVHAAVERVKQQRAVLDLPSLMLPWLAYVWGAGQAGNPLLAGQGLPGAAFVEIVYNLCDIELTPGLSSAASCPEAIWQAAKWWKTYYARSVVNALTTQEGRDTPQARLIEPTGRYAIRQLAAAVREDPDAGGDRPLPTKRPVKPSGRSTESPVVHVEWESKPATAEESPPAIAGL